jgi:PAS domain S-box-containing protein
MMQNKDTTQAPLNGVDEESRLNRYTWLLAILWTAMIVGSWSWNLVRVRQSMEEAARIQARETFQMDLLYRRWNALCGGVYAQVSDWIPPNPYLEVAERDIQTPSGRQLTKVNPAYMTRLVHELGKEASGIQGHITSLTPIRPENAPDLWEEESLQAFEQGETEKSGLEVIDGILYMRLMRPLLTEEACLSCHAAQGYKVGDIRGGISISVPVASLQTIARDHEIVLGLGHGGLWLLCLVGLFWGRRYLMQGVRAREQVENDLRASERRLNQSQYAASIGSYEWDLLTNKVIWSDEMYRIFGVEKETHSPDVGDFPQFVHPDDKHVLSEESFEQTTRDKYHEMEYRIIDQITKKIKSIHLWGEVVTDTEGTPIRIYGSLQDITERKQVEEALQQHREWLEATLTSIGDGIVVTDATKAITLLNPVAEKLTGWSAKEAIGQKVGDVFHIINEETRQPVEDPVERVLKTGFTIGLANHTLLIARDGSEIPIGDSAAPIHDAKEVLHGAVLVFRDVSERKQAADRDRIARDVLNLLNHSENTVDTIHAILQLIKKSTGFEAVGIRLREGDDFPYYQTSGFPEHFVQMENSLCARDEAGEVVRDIQGNPALECMCGNILCSRTNPQFPFFTEGGSFWSNCTTDMLASTTEEDRQARTRDRCNAEGYESVALVPLRVSNEIIGLLQLNDHRRDLFSLEMIRFLEGLGASIGIALRRKQTEEALRKSEEKFRSVFEDSGIAMALGDSNGRYVQINKTMTEIFGYSQEELLSMSTSDITYPGDTTPSSDVARQLWTSEGDAFSIEKRYIHKDGHVISGITTISPVRNHNGETLYLLGQMQDITERKHMEQELVHLERLRAVGELSAGVSHNLNNILTNVLGPAQLLKRKTDDPELLREVDDIVTSAVRARDLIHELHLSVRTQEEESLTPVPVDQVVQQAVQTARPRWKDEPESRGIAIDVVTRWGDVPLIQGTEAGLHGILTNFIFNAVDAMPEGGTITIETQHTENHVEIVFSDAGSGMNEETKRRIFEPFFTTKMDLGTGLGLSTVYRTVTNWGGTIEVDSTSGEGTTFTLRFPVWTEEVAEKEGKVAAQSTRSGKILVVDDDEEICGLLSRLLDEHHEVEALTDGRRALERVAPGKYDVAMIDLGMSGISGDQLMRQIKNIDPQVTTVLITGWDLSDTDTRASSFDFHITKPFDDLDEVEGVVARAIELHDQRVGEAN